MINVALLGNNRLAVEVINHCLQDPEANLLAVLNPNDSGVDGNSLSLKNFVLEHHIPFIQPNTINNPEAIETLRRWKPDIMLSCSYAKILKKEAIMSAGSACLNFHFSLLPKYRGCMPLVNAIANGEKTVGVTLHFISPGIDTGDIVEQVPILLPAHATAAEAYGCCVDRAVALFKDWWPLIKTKAELPRRAQKDTEASYYTFVYPNDRWVNWDDDAEMVACHINALTNGSYPAARTVSRIGEIELLGSSEPVEGVWDQPGKILSVDGAAMTVACARNAVRVAGVRFRDTLLEGCQVQSMLACGEMLISPGARR
ncbi:hypothetical protein GTO91_07285 [Heliobacterium undosum]|uniref:Methionyl-tRNA formyltransferase n=1 Tax=Heliomicrobium undosum TaxID=121734 RepID=A0A845L6Z2_9FIRM|nr:formyltransferase family protein [Heliomicrobium undosum]MZP29508.1 hypothetical protein [Heliomicrobium undosum]